MKIKSQNMNPQLLSTQHIQKLGLSWQQLFNPSLAIHANRELNMSKIKTVGFDMDYTLAVYKKLPMESLQYDLARDFLIAEMGYPQELKHVSFDQTLVIRGLVIDKDLGNILKLDDQSYVWRAMHCRQALTADQIINLYGTKRIKVGDERYYSLDTFFSIPEACLFIDTLECFYELKKVDNLDGRFMAPNSKLLKFNQIFTDIRLAMDTIHSNNSLKSVIRGNIQDYVMQDHEIEIALRKLRNEGKKIFLLTNSNFDYTNTVLTYVFDCEDKQKSWTDFFDYVIVSAQKPAFFTQTMPFVMEQSAQTSGGKKIFSGGNMQEFHRMCEVRGQEILYVGDHIYGDILRSKKDSLWRTCLIIKELNFDIRKSIEYKHEIKTLRQIHTEQSHGDKRLMRLRTLLGIIENSRKDNESDPHLVELLEELKKEIKRSTSKLQKLKTRHLKLSNDLEKKFHPHWGRLFKENQELSRFGAQVRQYACIYTDHIKNLLHYGANHLFIARKEQMTHELDLED